MFGNLFSGGGPNALLEMIGLTPEKINAEVAKAQDFAKAIMEHLDSRFDKIEENQEIARVAHIEMRQRIEDVYVAVVEPSPAGMSAEFEKDLVNEVQPASGRWEDSPAAEGLVLSEPARDLEVVSH